MPRKKKRFIDKNKATTFRIIPGHSIQQFEESHEGKDEIYDEFDEKFSNPESINTRHEEQIKYGVFYDDDYDYMQHLREPGKHEENVQFVRILKNSKRKKIEEIDEEEEKEDEFEEEENKNKEELFNLKNQLRKEIKVEDGDIGEIPEDVRAALEGEDEEGGDLEDDFVVQANQSDEEEGKKEKYEAIEEKQVNNQLNFEKKTKNEINKISETKYKNIEKELINVKFAKFYQQFKKEKINSDDEEWEEEEDVDGKEEDEEFDDFEDFHQKDLEKLDKYKKKQDIKEEDDDKFSQVSEAPSELILKNIKNLKIKQEKFFVEPEKPPLRFIKDYKSKKEFEKIKINLIDKSVDCEVALDNQTKKKNLPLTVKLTCLNKKNKKI